MADEPIFDPIELSEQVGQILNHTSTMLGVLDVVRGDVEDVRASVNQLYDRVTAISGGQQTLRNDFHTLLEANMRHDKDIKSLWRAVAILFVVVGILGVISVYAVFR